MYHHATNSLVSNQPHPESKGQLPGKHFTDGPAMAPRFHTVTAAIMHYVRTIPNGLAAIDHSKPGCHQISYADLGRRSRRLALALRAAGVGSGDRVPLVVKRGIDMVVGITAILRCGAQYVPLDGGVAPKGTIQRVVEQSACKVVLCLPSTARRLSELELGCSKILIIGEEPVDTHFEQGCDGSESIPGESSPTPESGCYIIYTSGKQIKQRSRAQNTELGIVNIHKCRNYGDSERSGCYP